VRIVLTLVAFVVTLAAVAATAVVVVIVFAGPHSDILPAPLQAVVFIAGWAAVLCLPVVAARKTWRRLGAAGGAQ
jgi:hypothetical protein